MTMLCVKVMLLQPWVPHVKHLLHICDVESNKKRFKMLVMVHVALDRNNQLQIHPMI